MTELATGLPEIGTWRTYRRFHRALLEHHGGLGLVLHRDVHFLVDREGRVARKVFKELGRYLGACTKVTWSTGHGRALRRSTQCDFEIG